MTGEEAVFDWPTVPRGGAPDSYLSSLSLPGGGGSECKAIHECICIFDRVCVGEV